MQSLAASTPAFVSNPRIDASGEKLSIIFRAPKTGTLDKAEFRVGAVVNTAGGVRVSFQDVDLTTGFPDGTQDQYRATAVVTTSWTDPGLMTDDGTDTGAKRTVTAGELLAFVMEFEAFTASDVVVIGALGTQELSAPNGSFPYSAVYTASWADTNNLAGWIVLKYDDGTYAAVVADGLCASGVNTHAINTGTTPDEAGLIFQVPVACSIDRAYVRMALAGDANLVLYDSSGSALATVALDADVKNGTGGAWHEVILPAAQPLTASTTYRMVVKPTSATSVSIYSLNYASTAIMDGVPGGSALHWTERADAGAWSETTTRRPFISLGISDVTTSSSSGGPMIAVS